MAKLWYVAQNQTLGLLPKHVQSFECQTTQSFFKLNCRWSTFDVGYKIYIMAQDLSIRLPLKVYLTATQVCNILLCRRFFHLYPSFWISWVYIYIYIYMYIFIYSLIYTTPHLYESVCVSSLFLFSLGSLRGGFSWVSPSWSSSWTLEKCWEFGHDSSEVTVRSF